jgi:hypothetical protein
MIAHDGEELGRDRAEETIWQHFLYGNPNGGFIHRPPEGAGGLSRQHVRQIARLMKRLSPRSASGPAFAIGNLERDASVDGLGSGGIVIAVATSAPGFSGRIPRGELPFCHAIALVDRYLDAHVVFAALAALYKAILPDEDGVSFARTYRRHAKDPAVASALVGSYLGEFDLVLPAPRQCPPALRWTDMRVESPQRMAIAHADDAPFEVIAEAAARIAAMLVASDVPWAWVSTGQEVDAPDGLTVHFVPDRDALGGKNGWPALRLEELPEEDEELAWTFGALGPSWEVPAAPRVPASAVRALGDEVDPASARATANGAPGYPGRPVFPETLRGPAAMEPFPLVRRSFRVGPWVALGLGLGLGVPAALLPLGFSPAATASSSRPPTGEVEWGDWPLPVGGVWPDAGSGTGSLGGSD